MAVWYLAHDDELLIDIDDPVKPARGGPWLEIFFRRRLREAEAAGLLALRDCWLARSTSARHYHVIVRLAAPMPLRRRLVWQLHLGSDLYRGRADLMRAEEGDPAPTLLIRPAPIPGFWRPPDHVCPCTAKHDTATLADDPAACATWRMLRGRSPWQLFGRSALGAERGVPLPLGRVPLARIRAKLIGDSDDARQTPQPRATAHDTAPVRRPRATADPRRARGRR